MKLFKNNKTGELYVSMGDKAENLLRFDGSPYNGNMDDVSEVDTKPVALNEPDLRCRHIIEETFNASEIKDWHLKDELLIPIDGNEVAFRVEHISADKVYFVAVDAVGKSTLTDVGKFLTEYLSKMPKSLVDRMVDIEHKANGEVIRKSKIALLSYANIVKDTDCYRLTGADDISFDGLLTDAETCKNYKKCTDWWWLDTPYDDSLTRCLQVGINGSGISDCDVNDTSAIVPCFALPRDPEGNGKYLVKVREIYEHTYCVEVRFSGDAIDIVHDNSYGCDTHDDYVDTEYEVSIYNENDPAMYDTIKAD